MKNVSTIMLDLMSRNDLGNHVFIEIGPNLSSQYFRYTTLPWDFSYGGETFLTVNGLMGLDPPRISKVLDKETYNISISDPNFTLRPFFEGGGGRLVGTNMSILAGFVNMTETTIYGTPPGEDFGEYFKLYEGYVDTADYSVSSEDVVLSITGSSPMGPLDLTRSLITSKNWIQRQYNGETGYDQVFEGSKEINLNWGKKE